MQIPRAKKTWVTLRQGCTLPEGLLCPLAGLTWLCFSPSPQVELPPYLERVKQQANEAFACQQWTQAIQLYSKAVQRAPHNAMLYGNRAAAYMKRKW